MPTKDHSVGDGDLGKKKHTPGTFAIVSLHVGQGPRLTHCQWAVYCAICSHASAQSDNICWPKQDVIAREACCSRFTVGRATDRLHDLGIIRKIEMKRRSGRWPSYKYEVLFPLTEPP